MALGERPFSFREFNDQVIPKLLNISDDICKRCNCSKVVLGRLEKFKMDVDYIGNFVCKSTVLEQHTASLIKELLRQIMDVPYPVAAFTDKIRYKQLDEVVTKLTNSIPSVNDSPPGSQNRKFGDYEPENQPWKLEIKTSRSNPLFESPAAFRRVTASYELLDPLHKACVLCFSAFPEDAEIRKRNVIYWWIGEELIAPPEGDDGEELGHKIIETLVEHGFVEDVITKDRVTSSCRVRPFIRSVLLYLADAAGFFDYLEDRESSADNLSQASKRRVCLVKVQKDDSSSSSSFVHLRRSCDSDMEHIQTMFNVNKCYLDIKLHWFWKLKGIKALYLGRCNSTAIQHIEVKSTKFLAGLAYMKELRFLSLQGVSKIVKLPDSICMARNLRIMDLRDCNDMEELPEAVKSLQKLTHLDLSGCYSLLRLPKGIASLSELQVLKGFLVRADLHMDSYACSFDDLVNLKKLRKLTISTSVRSFPMEEHLKVFGEMEKLRKLTIAWRGLYSSVKETAMPGNTKAFLGTLEKLDLRHIPYDVAPAWLVPSKLQNLRKLYIKGGKFLADLGTQLYLPWQVETLRLKYLPRLLMTQSELRNLFPRLSYLELVECSTLTLVQCENGVWRF